MRKLLLFLSVLLMIGWLMGVLLYKAGGIIHLLLLLAVISAIQGVIACPRTIENKLRV